MFVLPAHYTNLPDDALLQLMARQDELAFKTIYQRYAALLYSTAYSRLPVAHKAEDLVQEVFLGLYRNRTASEKILNLKAWLFSCLRNGILNEIRNFNTHKKHDQQIAALATFSTTGHSEHDLRLLEAKFHQALSLLTDRCRQVFLLSRSANLPNKKIAEQLDISVQAVEKHVTTALRVMRKELGKHEPGVALLPLSVLNHFIF